MNSSLPLFIAGHRGMVGSALMREAARRGIRNILTAARDELDLTRQAEVEQWMLRHRPGAVIVAAAKVGGIEANRSCMADFTGENLSIALNLIEASHKAGVQRLLFLGSSCIYPRNSPQPIPETSLLQGELEPTNEGYALAKIAGLKLCQYYRRQHGRLYHSIMPTNLYGPGDYYHPERSHVIPGMIQRFYRAVQDQSPSVAIWGSGRPRREFLHVDDLSSACFHLLELEDPPDWVNAGTGTDLSIGELATLVAETAGYRGEIATDPSRPDGMMQKLLDVSLMHSLGWKAKIGLREGLLDTWQCYLKETADGALRT